MTETVPVDFFGRRNSATRIEILDELTELSSAALRSFFRRLGAPHLMDEVVLPLLSEGDSQILAAVRDRPWPPWGLGARDVVAVLQTQLVSDGCWAFSPVYVTDEDLTNVGLATSLYKEALDSIAPDPNAEVHYLVVEGSLRADRTLREIGFTRAEDDVFLTEAARYFTYRMPVPELARALGLDQSDPADLLAHVMADDTYRRNAALHEVIYLGSRADWAVDRPDLAAEMTRLVRGGHYSKPAGVPGGSGRYQGWETLVHDATPPLEQVAQPVQNFLSAATYRKLLDYAVRREPDFQPSTVVEYGATAETVNQRIRRGSTLDDLGEFANLLKAEIREQLEEVRARLDHPAFPLGEIELQITASRDGDYFRMHQDTDGADTRELTFVYFFFAEPRKFSGGELRVFRTDLVGSEIRKTDHSQTIVPRGNLGLFFPSRHDHEVLPVRVPSKAFRDSRFSVTGWVHRR